MDIREAFASVFSRTGWTQAEVAAHLGMLPTALCNMGARRTYRLSLVCRMLDAVGYQVAFLPVGAKRIEGGYYLDGDMAVTEGRE